MRVPHAENFAIQHNAVNARYLSSSVSSYKIKFRYISLPFPPSLASGCPEFRAFQQYSNPPRKPATPDATLNVNLVRKLIRSCASKFVGCTRIWSCRKCTLLRTGASSFKFSDELELNWI